MKKIICLIKKHNWSKWIWAEECSYAVRRCERCGELQYGGTKEYIMTFPKALNNPVILERSK